MARYRPLVATLLRLTLSALLLFLVLRNVSVSEILQVARGCLDRWPILLFAASLPGFGILLRAARWRMLLSSQGLHPPLRKIVEALMVAMFFNQFLPSTVGGDLVRSYRLARLSDSPESATRMLAVVGMDRFLGFVGIAAVAVLAAAVSPSLIRDVPGFWLVIGLVPVAAVLLIALGSPAGRSMGRFVFSARLLSRVRSKAAVAYGTLAAYRGQPARLALSVGLSAALQGLTVLEYTLFARAVGLETALREFGIIVPIVTVIEMIPITVFGIGLRESALAVLGSSVGLTPGDAVTLAWLFVGTALCYAFAGGLTYAVSRSGSKPSAAGRASANLSPPG